MKQRIFTLLLALLSLSTNAWGLWLTRYINGIYYTIDTSDHTAEVRSGSVKYAGDVVIPSAIKDSDGTRYKVTKISYAAFSGSSSLTSVDIPYSVRSIVATAFHECPKLTAIKVSDDNAIYCSVDGILYNKDQTEILRYPQGKSDNTFIIPSSVTTIGDYAFSECSSLTSINFSDGVTTIGDYAFSECSSLTSINFSDGVTTIGDYAFNECSSLTSINFTDGVTTIGDYAFNKCSSLTSINIPNGITTINTMLFRGSSIEIIHIPASVTSIDSKAFTGCTQLVAINVSGDNANYQSIEGILYNKDLTTLLCYPEGKRDNATFIIPANVTRIGDYAFANCDNLTSIIIPSSVSKIETTAFWYSTLKSVYLFGKLDSYDCFRIHYYKDDNYYFPDAIIYTYKSEINKIKKDAQHTYKVEELKFYYPSDIQRDFRTISFTITRNDLPELIDSYVSASLTSVKFRRDWSESGYTEITPDKDGRYTVNGLEPDRQYDITVTCKFLGGEEYSITECVQTKKPNITISRTDCTQTSMTFSVNAESDETCVLTGKGVYVEGKGYYSCTGDKVVVRGLKPNMSYRIAPIAEYGGTSLSGEREWYNTASMKPSVTANVGPTSISVTGSYEKGDAHVSETGFTDQGTGISLVLTGLTPNTSYTVEYYVKTEEGSYERIKQTFTTPLLELTTLQPRCVSSTCAIVAAKTNMGDDEINAGFQWRKYDAPEELKSSEGYAAIYDGQLEGYIKNLQSASYYNVRAFYKSAEGKYYYGDWVTFDPSDFSYFEPTVHTYEATEIGSSSAKVKGYVLAGTDDIIEQGFEYWTTGSTECKAMRVRATDENNVSTVFSTGQVMTATLTDLLPSSTYCFRSFVKTASGTTYGEEQTFTTDASTTGIGNVETDAFSPVVVGYYDLSGRKHSGPQKGMNIVRYSDGSARKVLIK